MGSNSEYSRACAGIGENVSTDIIYRHTLNAGDRVSCCGIRCYY